MKTKVQIWYTYEEEIEIEGDCRLDVIETIQSYIESNKPLNCIDTDYSIIETLVPSCYKIEPLDEQQTKQKEN